MRKRRFKILLVIFLAPFLFLALVCLFLVFERVGGQIPLHRFRRALIAQGEAVYRRKLTPTAKSNARIDHRRWPVARLPFPGYGSRNELIP